MFLLCLCCVTCLPFPLFAAEPVEKDKTTSTSSETSVEQGIQEVFGSMFSIMGGAIGGMTKGMQEGARSIQLQLDNSSGTRLIDNQKDLAALTETRVLKTEQQKDGSWLVTLAIKNTQEIPVRLAKISAPQQVLLLDQEGFAYEQKPSPDRIITVPERAAQKVDFLFPSLDGATPKTIRLYGMDFAVPQPDLLRKIFK